MLARIVDLTANAWLAAASDYGYSRAFAMPIGGFSEARRRWETYWLSSKPWEPGGMQGPYEAWELTPALAIAWTPGYGRDACAAAGLGPDRALNEQGMGCAEIAVRIICAARQQRIPINGDEANGYVESFNARRRDELLNGEIFYTLKEAQIVIESWHRHDNSVRLQASLGYRPPAPEGFVPAFTAWPAGLTRSAPPAKRPVEQRPTLHQLGIWTIARGPISDIWSFGSEKVQALPSPLHRRSLDLSASCGASPSPQYVGLTTGLSFP